MITDNGRKRRDNESLVAYHQRLMAEKADSQKSIAGRMFWPSMYAGTVRLMSHRGSGREYVDEEYFKGGRKTPRWRVTC